MARLIYALNQSLDGYVDHDKFAPDPVLFRHFIDDVRSLAGAIYGRRMYEIMRYWDDERPEWDEDHRAYARAWRDMPKYVVTSTLAEVGPNAEILEGDAAHAIAELRARLDGQLEIAGPKLAGSVPELVDEYRIYLHPVVIGDGQPFFTGPRPDLRLIDVRRIGERAIRLSYVPA